ncbi:hypothetical protein SMICM17S_06648 [Streptomyces microflavus]
MRGTFIIDKAGTVRWSVVNGLPDARDLNDYVKALEALCDDLLLTPGQKPVLAGNRSLGSNR